MSDERSIDTPGMTEWIDPSAPSARFSFIDTPFRFVASIRCDACGFWRESKSNDRRTVELVFSEWSDEHENCEPAARYSFTDNEQVATQGARSEPRFCGYSACGDRGGPPEACGKELPCSVAGHFDAASELRRLWWLDHGCEVAALYGDDGEMQCNRCWIDFKRGSLVDLAQHVYTKKTERLASLASPELAKAYAERNASRIRSLLKDAAAAFGRSSDPFATAWLSEREVTLDECCDLSTQIGLAIRVYLNVLNGDKQETAAYLTPALLDAVDAEDKP